MMKPIWLLWVGLVLCLDLSAQETLSKTLSADGINTFTGYFEWGNATFSSWEKDEIEIEATYSINDGENNDAFQLTLKENDGEVSLNVDIKNIESLPKKIVVWKYGKKYSFPVGKNEDQSIQKVKKELGEDVQMYSQGVDMEIEVKVKVPASLKVKVEANYGNLYFENFRNRVVAKNTYGGIEAKFDEGASPQKAELFSTYSFVDVSLASSQGRDISMITEYGSLFTDLDIVLDEGKSEERSYYQRVAGTVNDGGNPLKMESTYSNVYLRKM
ncbi:MAG: hypothetical protein AAF655_12265 [Bacteroidota bacterium]